MKVQVGVGAAVLGLCALGAQAQVSSALGLIIGATTINTPASEGAGMLDIDVSPFVHNNTQGSVWNNVLSMDVGENLWITGVAWDLSATSIDPIMLSDISIAIINSAGDGIILNPFSAESVGSGTSSSGVDLFNLGQSGQAFEIADGQIYIEFFLPYNPIAGPEISYQLGSMLTLEVSTVPAPGSLAMGVGALAMGARRRRR